MWSSHTKNKAQSPSLAQGPQVLFPCRLSIHDSLSPHPPPSSHWPPTSFPPQGLCPHGLPCQDALPTSLCIAGSFWSFRSKCHLLGEAFKLATQFQEDEHFYPNVPSNPLLHFLCSLSLSKSCCLVVSLGGCLPPSQPLQEQKLHGTGALSVLIVFCLQHLENA